MEGLKGISNSLSKISLISSYTTTGKPFELLSAWKNFLLTTALRYMLPLHSDVVNKIGFATAGAISPAYDLLINSEILECFTSPPLQPYSFIFPLF